jgi:prepilin-type processing-associated H-X9-DG protein
MVQQRKVATSPDARHIAALRAFLEEVSCMVQEDVVHGTASVWRAPLGPRQIACLVLVLAVLSLFVLLPIFMSARSVARQHACVENMRQVGVALLAYAADYDGRLPPAGKWASCISAYGPINGNLRMFECPGGDGPACRYAMNSRVGGQDTGKLEDEDTIAMMHTTLLFESTSADFNASGSVSNVAWERHSIGANFLFIDGHVTEVIGTRDHPNRLGYPMKW